MLYIITTLALVLLIAIGLHVDAQQKRKKAKQKKQIRTNSGMRFYSVGEQIACPHCQSDTGLQAGVSYHHDMRVRCSQCNGPISQVASGDGTFAIMGKHM